MQRFNHKLKVVSAVLVQAFLLEQLAMANPDLVPQKQNVFEAPKVSLRLPESVASIEDAYVAKDATKTIYLIQDAHTNDSGQLNLSKALDAILTQDKDVRLVFSEAAIGDNSLAFLRPFKSVEERKKIATSYLKKGLLHGTEYLDLTSDHEFTLWGVENPELYVQSLENYKAVASERGRFEDYLKKIENTISTLKPRLYSPSLSVFDTQVEKFSKEEESLTDFFDVLSAEAAKHSVSVSSYAHLKKLRDLKDKEAQIDFAKANEEQMAAVASLTEAEKAELAEAAAESKSPLKLSSREQKAEKAFYALLEEKLGDRTKNFSELEKYFDYLKTAKSVEARKVLDEIQALEEALYAKLALSEDEKTLVAASKEAKLLDKLFHFTMTPSEYQAYKAASKVLDIPTLTGFLNKKIMDLGQHYDRAVFLESGYEDMVKRSEEFYDLTHTRDVHFIEKAIEKMDADSQKTAVLVTGGYHTPNLKSLLRDKGVSYISLQPQVMQETNIKRYESILLSQEPSSSTAKFSVNSAKNIMITHAANSVTSILPTPLFVGSVIPEIAEGTDISVPLARIRESQISAYQVAAARLATEDERYQKRVEDLKAWWASDRFDGVKRLHTAEQVAALQIDTRPDYTVQNTIARKYLDTLRRHQAAKTAINTFGPFSEVAAEAMARAGIEGIYFGGWAEAMRSGTSDQARYAYTWVAEVTSRVSRFLQQKARQQSERRSRMTAEQRAAEPEIDYLVPFFVDADTGHLAPKELVQTMMTYGSEAQLIGALHFEDQAHGCKKCGHMSGKVLVSTDEHIKRLNEARLQLDLMGLETLIVARTDAEAAEFITSNLDRRDHPFILGATNSEIAKPYHEMIQEARAQGLSEADVEKIHKQWRESAGLMTLGDAIIQAMEKSGQSFTVSADEIREFSKSASVEEMKSKAREIGISVYFSIEAYKLADKSSGIHILWDWDLPKTEELGYSLWMIESGTDMAIARSKAFLPYADIQWMEQHHPSVEQTKEWASALIEEAKVLGIPQPLLANNTSPSFYWRAEHEGEKMSDEELSSFLKEQAEAGVQFQFITYGGSELDNYGIQKFVKEFKEKGMLAWAEFQDEAIGEGNPFVKGSQTYAGVNYQAALDATGRGASVVSPTGAKDTMAQFQQALKKTDAEGARLAVKMVDLKNGSSEPEAIVLTTVPILDELHKSRYYTFAALLQNSRKPEDTWWGDEDLKELQARELVDSTGNIHGSVRNIVLSSVEGEGLETRYTGNPIAGARLASVESLREEFRKDPNYAKYLQEALDQINWRASQGSNARTERDAAVETAAAEAEALTKINIERKAAGWTSLTLGWESVGSEVRATAPVRIQPGVAQVSPELRAQFPQLFATKDINGRQLDPAQVITVLANAVSDDIPRALNARRELLESDLPTSQKYAFPNWGDTFTDSDGNTRTFREIVQGMLDNFFGIESELSWRLNDEVPVPSDIFPLDRPGLQITGPSNPLDMAINQFNADVEVRMPDAEDAAAAWFVPAGAPQDQTVGVFAGFENERALLAGEWDDKAYSVVKKGKEREYPLTKPRADRPTTIQRVPSIHLLDNHITIDGKPVSATAITYALHALNTHGSLTQHESGNYYYQPKIQTPEEAVIVEDTISTLEDLMGLERGTIKIEILYEEGNAGRYLPVLMWIWRARLIGSNVGRWDYIGSLLEMWKNDATAVFPDPQSINMNSPNLVAYQKYNALLNVMAGMKNGELTNAAPIGGMAAVMLYPNTDAYGRFKNNPKALRAMKLDKLRERLIGLIFVPEDASVQNATLEDILSGNIKGKIYDAYRQSWVATPDAAYVAAGNIPLRTALAELQALLDAPEDFIEIDGVKIATVQSGLTAADLALFQKLGLLNAEGKISPWVISKSTFKSPEDLFNEKLWNDLYAVPTGEITIERIQHAFYMSAQYGFQILNANYAAAIDDYELGLRFMNDLATYRIFVTWLWTAFQHNAKVTQDGYLKGPVLVDDKGVIPGENRVEIKAGTELTPEVFNQLWDLHNEWVKAFFAEQDKRGEESRFNRAEADVIMDVLKRQLLSDRYLQHSPRVLFVIAEADEAQRKDLLDAIFAESRDIVVAKVESGEWAKSVLEAHDYVYDYFPYDESIAEKFVDGLSDEEARKILDVIRGEDGARLAEQKLTDENFGNEFRSLVKKANGDLSVIFLKDAKTKANTVVISYDASAEIAEQVRSLVSKAGSLGLPYSDLEFPYVWDSTLPGYRGLPIGRRQVALQPNVENYQFLAGARLADISPEELGQLELFALSLFREALPEVKKGSDIAVKLQKGTSIFEPELVNENGKETLVLNYKAGDASILPIVSIENPRAQLQRLNVALEAPEVFSAQAMLTAKKMAENDTFRATENLLTGSQQISLEIPASLLAGITDEAIFDVQAAHLKGEIATVRRAPYGANVAFYVSGIEELSPSRQDRLREIFSDVTVFVSFESPKEGLIATLVDTGKAIVSTAGKVQLPVTRIQNNDLPAWKIQIQLGIANARFFAKDGKLAFDEITADRIPDALVSAYGARAEATPDKATYKDIVSGQAKLSTLLKYVLKPITKIPLNYVLKAFQTMQKMVGQAA